MYSLYTTRNYFSLISYLFSSVANNLYHHYHSLFHNEFITVLQFATAFLLRKLMNTNPNLAAKIFLLLSSYLLPGHYYIYYLDDTFSLPTYTILHRIGWYCNSLTWLRMMLTIPRSSFIIFAYFYSITFLSGAHQEEFMLDPVQWRSQGSCRLDGLKKLPLLFSKSFFYFKQ